MKGIVITKLVIIVAVIIAVMYFLTQQGTFQGITGPATKSTAIKSSEEASKQITGIGSGVENVSSILEDIDKRLG